MSENKHQPQESYKLVFTHEIICSDGTSHPLEEPIAVCSYVTDLCKPFITSVRNDVIRDLFRRMAQKLEVWL